MIRTRDVTHLAEQATIGAVMLGPEHFEVINTWTRPHDFTDAWHRRLWQTIRLAAAEHEDLDPHAIGRAMQQRFGKEAALHRIVDVLDAVPAGQDDPRPFARCVVDQGVRREIALEGVTIEAGARAAALGHEARPVMWASRVAQATMLVAGERWAQAHGAPDAKVSTPISPQLRALADDLEMRRAADKFVAEDPFPDMEIVRRNEERLIACLATHPAQVAPTMAWLSADRLVNRPWRSVYIALGDLVDRGQAINAVVLAQEVNRVARTEGAAPDLGDLLFELRAEAASVPTHLRANVAGDQVRSLAQAGARVLRAGRDNPGIHVPDLISTGQTVLDALERVASALPARSGAPAPEFPGLARAQSAGHAPEGTPPEPRRPEGPTAA